MMIRCDTGGPKYPPGFDPPSMAVQLAHKIWDWYMPEHAVGPHAEPLLRNWANWLQHRYRHAADGGRKKFTVMVTIGPDSLPFMQVVG